MVIAKFPGRGSSIHKSSLALYSFTSGIRLSMHNSPARAQTSESVVPSLSFSSSSLLTRRFPVSDLFILSRTVKLFVKAVSIRALCRSQKTDTHSHTAAEMTTSTDAAAEAQNRSQLKMIFHALLIGTLRAKQNKTKTTSPQKYSEMKCQASLIMRLVIHSNVSSSIPV